MSRNLSPSDAINKIVASFSLSLINVGLVLVNDGVGVRFWDNENRIRGHTAFSLIIHQMCLGITRTYKRALGFFLRVVV